MFLSNVIKYYSEMHSLKKEVEAYATTREELCKVAEVPFSKEAFVDEVKRRSQMTGITYQDSFTESRFIHERYFAVVTTVRQYVPGVGNNPSAHKVVLEP